MLHRAVVTCSLVVACGPVITEPSAATDGTTTGTIDPPVDTGTGAPGTSAPGTSEPGTSVSTSEPGTVTTSDDTSDDTMPDPTVNDTFDPDGGSSIECDVWSQDCPRGEKCNPWANDGGDRWNASACVTIDPDPAQVGDACVVEGAPTSGIDNCDFASVCFHVDPETNVGTCIARCSGSEAIPICTDDATTCTISHDGVLVLCLPVCDPLAQDCAHGSDACMPALFGGFSCFPTYSPTAAAGEPCEYRDSCVAGTACRPAEYIAGCAAKACCTPFCDDTLPDADASCPGYANGEVCDPWASQDPGPQPVGLCVIPR